MLRVAGVFALSLLVVACAADDEVGGSTADVVAQGSVLDNKVAVFPDRLEFDADARKELEGSGVLDKIRAGSEPVYLVGRPQADALDVDGSIKKTARNPSGYLRRAVSFASGARGGVVIKTEPASMADAVEEMKKVGILDLDDPNAKSANGENSTSRLDALKGNTEKTWRTQIGPPGGYVPVDESNKVLVRQDGVVLNLIKGRVSITPTVEVHLRTEHFQPKEVTAAVTAAVSGDLAIRGDASGDSHLDEGGVLFPKQSFGASLKGLPLTIDIEVKWRCDLAATSKSVFTFGATTTGTVRGGLSWDGNTKGILEETKPYTFGRVGPTTDSATKAGGNCHLTSTINMQVFDAAGPTVVADQYANVDFDAAKAKATGAAHATLAAGIEATVTGSLKPFGFKLAEINVRPYRNEKELFNQDLAIGK